MPRGYIFLFRLFTNSLTRRENLLDDSNGSRVHADFLAVFSSTPAAAADSFVIITVSGGGGGDGGGSELQPHSLTPPYHPHAKPLPALRPPAQPHLNPQIRFTRRPFKSITPLFKLFKTCWVCLPLLRSSSCPLPQVPIPMWYARRICSEQCR